MEINNIVKYLDNCKNLNILIDVIGVNKKLYKDNKEISTYLYKLFNMMTIHLKHDLKYYEDCYEQVYCENNKDHLKIGYGINSRLKALKNNIDYKFMYLSDENMDLKIGIYEAYDQKLIRYFVIEYKDNLLYIHDLDSHEHNLLSYDHNIIYSIKMLVERINSLCLYKNKEFLLYKFSNDLNILKEQKDREVTGYNNNMIVKVIDDLLKENECDQ